MPTRMATISSLSLSLSPSHPHIHSFFCFLHSQYSLHFHNFVFFAIPAYLLVLKLLTAKVYFFLSLFLFRLLLCFTAQLLRSCLRLPLGAIRQVAQLDREGEANKRTIHKYTYKTANTCRKAIF